MSVSCPPHQWGYSPTVGTYTCMKCSERRNYDHVQYADAEREYNVQVRNTQQSSDMWWMIERDDLNEDNYLGGRRPMYLCWLHEPGSKYFPRGQHSWTADWQRGARFATKEAAEAHTNGDPLLHVRDHAMIPPQQSREITALELLNFLLDIEQRALAALDDTQVDAIALQTFRVRELRHLLSKLTLAKIGARP